MYHFFVEPHQIGAEEIRIEGADVNHIRNVLRMKPGEEILISSREGGDYFCRVEELEPEYVSAKILEEWENKELPARIHLFQGLPKGDKMELIIQKAVELGAYRVVPVSMKRSVVKLDAKKADAKRKRWNAVSESAAKQSKRSLIPEVAPLMTYKEAVKEAAGYDMVLLPYESADGIRKTRELLASVKPGTDIAVFIGPEGGFEDEEVELARENGAEIVTLGKRILRTETAGLCMLSALMRSWKCNWKITKEIEIKMEAYFDNSATTKVLDCVKDAVVDAMCVNYGNAAAKHRKGVEAENLIREAKKAIADTLKVQEKEILFTSGGTESNNTALIGTALANRRAGKHLITTGVEHPSIYNTMSFLEEMGI